MYIQITDMCNMSCEHCCFSCNSNKGGTMMSKQTFKRALLATEELEETLTLGGGEPTIHPQFWELFGLAMGAGLENVWMATNGGKSDIAKALAYLSNPEGHFQCALSQDPWHDPIDPEVVATFKRTGGAIRDVSRSVISVGAAEENGLGMRTGCACSSLHIKPNGDLYQCGCPDSLMITNINRVNWLEEMNNHSNKYEDIHDTCYRNLEATEND